MNIKKFREDNFLTVKEFSDIIGIPKSTYYDYERGIYRTNSQNIEKIYKAVERIEKEQKEIDKILNPKKSRKKYALIALFIWVLLCILLA